MKKYGGTEEETTLLYSIVTNAKTLRNVSIVFSMGVRAPQMFLYTLYKLAPSDCAIECSRAI
jgi:hypothetical protein